MKGILLINLGTPEEPTAPAVRKYLKQLLSDPLVIDINPMSRWLLLHSIILPFRSSKSAAAYQKIWTDQGSPLLFHTQELTARVAQKLGENYAVEMAMRYGQPSIENALSKLKEKGVSSITILPLYPQYSLSATESSIKEVKRVMRKMDWEPELKILPPFYSHPGFIAAFAEVGKPLLTKLNPDHVLFSFHGLPERQVKKTDPSGQYCMVDPLCCERMTEENKNCYRAHCVQTARAIARALELPEEKYTISFQSRLGRTPWIKPYTDLLLSELAQSGKKRLVVFSPSFVADCLETLEEIAIRGKQSFIESGGESLELVPSLNSHPKWVEAVCEMVTTT